MEDFNLLGKINRVTAPADFERQVMERLAARRRELPQVRRLMTVRYSLAGAAAFLLVGFIVMNMFVLEKGPHSEVTGQKTSGAIAPRDSIQITERVRYAPEIRRASSEPRTAYVLEQVSDASNILIKY